MSGRPRVAVVGAGWGADLHLVAFRRAGADLVGLHSRTRSRAEQLARTHGVPCVTDSLTELVERTEPDLVSIASPPPAHCEQTLAVVAAGVHVLCDKPVAMSAAEAETMLRAAEKAGVVHATGFIWRYDPALQRMRELVADGAVGTVLEVHSTCPLGAPVMPMNWIYDAQAGGGALMQHGSHVLDRVRFLLGAEITALSGRLLHDLTEAPIGPEFHNTMDVFTWSREHQGEATGHLPTAPVTADVGYDFLAELSSGARARFWESTHVSGPTSDQVLVFGDEATLAWSGTQGLSRHVGHRPAEQIDVADFSGSGAGTPHEVGLARWEQLARQLLASVDTGAQPSFPTLHDGWQVARITDALHRSHETRAWEAL